MNNKKHTIEILAPAGDFDSVVAAVRCGANAVYLGGTRLNARKGASTFDLPLLKKAVAYCHGRDVAVHLTLNTIVFDDELSEAALSIEEACEAGVDALIVADLGVARLARTLAPTVELHASTQLSVHNLDGVKALATLGFSRAVVARELSLEELAFITKHSPIDIEAFVHGALCMSVSGQCYLSGMIGGRSGNRGRCAQPCRLPFASEESTHALSLRDLSQIQYLPQYAAMGVTSLKIEGRLKRPEYVAAAVTACVQVKAGKTPDYKTLEAVFSRSGFTDDYATGRLGDHMFGTRRKEDVLSAQKTLKTLANLYHMETPLIPLSMDFVLQKDMPSTLTVTDNHGRVITVNGDAPQLAHTTPTTEGRAQAALEKTGGTPFFLDAFTCQMDDDVLLPASVLSGLRREALTSLLELRSAVVPHSFTPFVEELPVATGTVPDCPNIRIRILNLDQLSAPLLKAAEYLILPLSLLTDDFYKEATDYLDKIILELPSIAFGKSVDALHNSLTIAAQRGICHALVGNLFHLSVLEHFSFTLHGDFSLNTVNHLALEVYDELDFASMTMSLEYGLLAANPNSPIPRGVVAYGLPPVMIYRNHPAGMNGADGFLTDRKNIQFWVERQGEVSVMYNSVPLSMADRSGQLRGLDFTTLYFTHENLEDCQEILASFVAGTNTHTIFTRGMYQPRVL